MATSSAAIYVRFLSVIDPKSNLNGKKECFLEQNSIFMVYKFEEDRMVHNKLIKFRRRKKFEERAPN